MKELKTVLTSQINLMKIFGGFMLFGSVFLFNPFNLTAISIKVLAVALLMIFWWISEAIPMPVVALIPLLLFPLLGISTFSETAVPYSNEVIFLFMGGFLIGLAIEKWGLHKRIALSIVSKTGTSGNKILLGFILSTGFISMWLSNTATTMMMYPIAVSVISVVLTLNEKEKSKKNFALAMMLSIAYASNFGGIATIIGTPPNAAYVTFISKKYNLEISFSDWMVVALPIAMILLFILFFVITFMFPNHLKKNQVFEEIISKDLNELGSITKPEVRVLIIFIVTAFLWITRSLINQLNLITLDDNMIAIFGAVLMFIVPSGNHHNPTEKILVWKDTHKMSWGILLLFGGGISLAAALEKAGIIQMIGNLISGHVHASLLLMILIVSMVSIFLSELMSNVAQVIVFAPIVTILAELMGFHPFLIGIPMTLAASCSSMLPMGTPPNAIVFSSGYVKTSDMIKAGFVLNLLSIALIVLATYHLVPLMLRS